MPSLPWRRVAHEAEDPDPSGRFESLAMAVYDGTREGVRVSGSDQLISDVTDAIQEVVESYEVDVGGRKVPRDLLEDGVLQGVRVVRSPVESRGMIKESMRAAEHVPACKPGFDEPGFSELVSHSRMDEGGVYGIHVAGSTGTGLLSKVCFCTLDAVLTLGLCILCCMGVVR